MKYLSAILLFVLALTFNGVAQQSTGGVTKVTTEIFAGGSSAIAVVKGAPFSAEAVSESVQILHDGNKITRSNTTRMFRDGEGRFRREGNSPNVGSSLGVYYGAVSGFTFQDTISIFDPVSNFRYSLNPSAKTATRTNSPQFKIEEGAVIVNGQLKKLTKAQIEANAGKKTEAVSSYFTVLGQGGVIGGNTAGKTESLGTREIEGVLAEGTRTVTTIPAGAIGNERPIETVYERWYSKELQLVVYSKNTDPRFGEQTYRLTNINHGEPDRSLFAPPADYKIVTQPAFNFITTKPQ